MHAFRTDLLSGFKLLAENAKLSGGFIGTDQVIFISLRPFDF